MSEFGGLVDEMDEAILAVHGTDCIYEIVNGPTYSLQVVLDRSEQTRTNLRVWATGWAKLASFELGEPRPGDFLHVGDDRMAVVKVFPDEFGGRELHLVIA